MVVVEEKKSIKSSSSKDDHYQNVWLTLKPFVNGGATGTLIFAAGYVATSSLYAVTLGVGTQLAHKFRKNMVFTLLREATYSTALFGSFEILKQNIVAANGERPLTLYQEACCGLTSGAIAACAAYPIHSAYTHMLAPATQPATHHVNYRNVFHSIYRIAADKGVSALWKGASVEVKFKIALHMSMFASYNRSIDYFKESFGFNETRAQVGAIRGKFFNLIASISVPNLGGSNLSITITSSASLASGFFASACAVPVGRVLVEMHQVQLDANGKYPYKGFLDCALKILKSRGPFTFYSVFPASFLLITPYIMTRWMILEAIQKYETSIGL